MVEHKGATVRREVCTSTVQFSFAFSEQDCKQTEIRNSFWDKVIKEKIYGVCPGLGYDFKTMGAHFTICSKVGMLCSKTLKGSGRFNKAEDTLET